MKKLEKERIEFILKKSALETLFSGGDKEVVIAVEAMIESLEKITRLNHTIRFILLFSIYI